MVVRGNEPKPLKIQSIVGLTSLFAVSTIESNVFEKMKDFKKRTAWFERYRKQNNRFWPNEERSDGKELLLSLVRKDRLVYLLKRLLNENEFLSPGGIRALSKKHELEPYSVTVDNIQYTIRYDAGDSTS